MKISTKGRYGLRAFIDLACYGAEEPVSISSISARQEISERYLEQLMAKLKKAGLVKSIRGAGGGIGWQRMRRKFLLVMYSEHLKETWNLRLVQRFHSEDSCEIQGSCITKYVWKKVNESMAQTVDSIMINTLVEMNKEVKKEGQKDE